MWVTRFVAVVGLEDLSLTGEKGIIYVQSFKADGLPDSVSMCKAGIWHSERRSS